MARQRRVELLAAGVTMWLGMAPLSLAAQGYGEADAYQAYEPAPLEARIWLDRGDEPVLRRGDQVRIYYRVSEGAFVAIFHIDSNGTARMVFPNSPQENHYARGGRDYRVLFPGSSYWYVGDDPGMGYYFIVASPEPFDFASFRYSHFSGGWDLGFVGRQVYRDPYLAMDDYVAALIPDWEYVGYALDFTAYHVDGHYDYPRFLCYDCHGFLPYRSWNPYHYSCSSFRVVIYNDPYFYPVSRYRGTRVVYVQPQRGIAQFGFKERATGEPGTPQVISRVAGGGNVPGVEGTETRRAVPRGSTTGTVAPGTSGGGRVAAPPGRSQPGVEGTAPRRSVTGGSGEVVPLTRPSGALPGSTSGAVPRTATPPTGGTVGRGTVLRPTDPARTSPPASGTERPVLERRPPTGGTPTTPTVTPPTRPSTGGTATTPPTRPTTKVIKPGGGGGGGTVTVPPRGSGGGDPSGSVVRGGGSTPSRSLPATRSTPTPSPSRTSGGSAVTRTTPTSRTGGGSSAARSTPPRSSSGSSAARSTPPRSSSGSSAARSTPPRSSSGSSAARSTPPPRSSSGSSAARSTPPRSSSGSSAARSTPPRSGSSGGGGAKPPPKRPPGGGGG